jgi:hypothetical protein
MALMNYSTVFSAAGFAGESFDVAKGYDVTYTTTAGDLAFAAAGKTLTLTAGVFPTWIRTTGKVFVTASGTNPGPFTVVSIDPTFKILTVLETVVDETPVGTTVVDGSADTAIISNLLKSGNGNLTTDAPHFLKSSGAVGAARALNISAMEAESTVQGAQALRGRFFYMSFQNTDLSSNPITVTSSATINGAASLIVTTPGDYMFHHFQLGEWRANQMPRISEHHASVARVNFTAADWDAGASKESIKILQQGVPVAGEVGPHALRIDASYVVQVLNTDLSPPELVQVEVQFDILGNVTLRKAKKAPDFNGVAVLVGSV